jgi:hypothetical protein
MYSFPTFKLINLINTPCRVFSVTLLKKSKDLACCLHNGKISIYSMANNELKLIQTLDVLNGKTVFRVKELPNNMLVSCQDEQSIRFYQYDESTKLYTEKKKKTFHNFIDNLLYTKDNDILLYQNNYPGSGYKLVLFDFSCNMEKELISNYDGKGLIYEPFKFLDKNIVAVIMNRYIYLIDINKKYNIVTKVESIGFGSINCLCKIKNNYFVIGGEYGGLTLWEYKDDQLKQKKEYTYNIKKGDKDIYIMSSITDLLYLGNNTFFIGGIYCTASFSFSFLHDETNDASYSGYITDLYKVI